MRFFNYTMAVPVMLAFAAPGANAATFSWDLDTVGIAVNASSLQQTVDGVTVTATGYVAEKSSGDATVFGPLPTSTTTGRLRPFGIDLRDLGGEQLGLFANPEPGVDLSGSDFGGGGVAPGFDSGPYRGGGVAKFDFALFQFSAAVDISQILVDDVTNNSRDIWAAAGTSTPDFSSGFLAGLSGLDIVNGDDDASDGLFAHDIGFTAITTLLIGAPPRDGLGALAAGNSQFYIAGFDFEASAVVPPVPAVPLPAGLPLVLGALGLLGFVSRNRAKT